MGVGKRRQKLCVAKRVSWVSSRSGSSEVDANSLGMFRATSGWKTEQVRARCGTSSVCREGANREKLTVKKLIDNEMFFFHRLCPLQTMKNRRKP